MDSKTLIDRQAMMYNLITVYISPIMYESGLFIDKNGYIGLIGGRADEKFTITDDEGVTRKLVLPKNDTEYKYCIENKDEYIIFNPLKNPQHMLNIVLNNLKVDLARRIVDELEYSGIKQSSDDAFGEFAEIDPDDYIGVIELPTTITDEGHLIGIDIIAFDGDGNEYKKLGSGSDDMLAVSMWEAAWIACGFISGREKNKIKSTLKKIDKIKVSDDIKDLMRFSEDEQEEEDEIKPKTKKHNISTKSNSSTVKLSQTELFNLSEDDDCEMI